MKKLLLLLLLSTGFSVNALSIEEPYPPWECIDGYIISFDKTHCVKVGEDRNAERPVQPSTLWYENGQKKSESHSKDGRLNGKWTIWFENGQKVVETNFIDNNYDGKHTEWYENGQIKIEGFNENGKSVGWWRFWLEDGQIDYVKNYNIVTN